MLNTQNKFFAIPNDNKKMTQKYKKEEKANKYINYIEYHTRKTKHSISLRQEIDF